MRARSVINLVLLIGGMLSLAFSPAPTCAAGRLAVLTVDGPFVEALRGAADAFESIWEVEVDIRVLPDNNAVVHLIRSSRPLPAADLCLLDEDFWDVGIADELITPFESECCDWARRVIPLAQAPSGYGPAVCSSCFGLAYNRNLVQAPTSWGDLWDAVIAGHCGLYSPESDEMMMVLMAATALVADDPYSPCTALARMVDLFKGPCVIAKSEEDMVDKLVAGDVRIAPMWIHNALQAAAVSPDIAFAVPSEGAFVNHLRPNLITGCRNPSVATEFARFLLEEPAQLGFMNKALCLPTTELARDGYVTAQLLMIRDQVSACPLLPDWHWIGLCRHAWSSYIRAESQIDRSN